VERAERFSSVMWDRGASESLGGFYYRHLSANDMPAGTSFPDLSNATLTG